MRQYTDRTRCTLTHVPFLTKPIALGCSTHAVCTIYAFRDYVRCSHAVLSCCCDSVKPTLSVSFRYYLQSVMCVFILMTGEP